MCSSDLEELGVFEDLAGKDDVERRVVERQLVRVGENRIHARTGFKVDPMVGTAEEVEYLSVGTVDIQRANVKDRRLRDTYQIWIIGHMASNAISEVFQG